MKITFIGGGNMASALIGGLLNHGAPSDSISVIDLDENKRLQLEKDYGICTFPTATAESLESDAILLAVKPQQMKSVCITIAPLLRDHIVISIAAGVRTATLQRWLSGYSKIIRTMPNTPSLISAGMTGLYAPEDISSAEKLGAERILQSVGRTVWVSQEKDIDSVTAISGSGPAYLFLFLESLEEAAVALGLSEKQAKALAYETVVGAAKLASQSDESAATLRERVTSKGGTTEAALNVLMNGHFKDLIQQAVDAARSRGAALGEMLDQDA